MKVTKRLLIEYQHREVTISIAGSTRVAQDGESDEANTPPVCPICGSPWITIVTQVDGHVSACSDRIRNALKQSGLHLQDLPAGQLQICRRSFEEVKEML